MTAKSVIMLAAKINAELLRDYQEYLDECKSWYSDGYRPHYCEHGTNQWTDYDNICGYCEDGISMRDGITRRQFAISRAKAISDAFNDGLGLIVQMYNKGLIQSTEVSKYIDRLSYNSGMAKYK